MLERLYDVFTYPQPFPTCPLLQPPSLSLSLLNSPLPLSPFPLLPSLSPRPCLYMLTWCTRYNNYLINLGLSPPLCYTCAHSVSSCRLQGEGVGVRGRERGVVGGECGSRLGESERNRKHTRNRVSFAE